MTSSVAPDHTITDTTTPIIGATTVETPPIDPTTAARLDHLEHSVNDLTINLVKTQNGILELIKTIDGINTYFVTFLGKFKTLSDRVDELSKRR
jgi:hypothetical protein